jgi:glycosyltransferase involved in cell wall biosynthesis
MKIIYIANSRIPTEKAHGIQIMKMCEAFARAGNEVELILPRRLNQIKNDPFEYYKVERIFKIKKIPCLDLITLDKYIGHLGLWLESLTFYLSFLLRFILERADMFYTRDRLFLPLGWLRKNVVFEAHAFPSRFFLYSPFIKRLKKIIVITRGLKELFIERGISAEKILVAPDGVDFDKFNLAKSREECRNTLNLPLDKKIVLYAGHLYPWKGADALAQSSRLLPDNVLVYFVGGTGEDVERFKNKYSDIQRVEIIGYRPYGEIPLWLRAADVLVLPNSGKEDISKYWTSPMKMFEYMASGTPIVASDLPSIGEILDETNAVLVAPDDQEALAEGIRRVLGDTNLARALAQKTLEDVRRYSWQRRSEAILNFALSI